MPVPGDEARPGRVRTAASLTSPRARRTPVLFFLYNATRMRTTTADGLDLRRIRTMTAPGVSRRTPSAVADVRGIRTGSGRTGRTRRVGRGGGIVPCPIHDRTPFLE